MGAPNNENRAIAAEVLSAVPCSVELPAGTGKTQLIATITELAGNLEKRPDPHPYQCRSLRY